MPGKIGIRGRTVHEVLAEFPTAGSKTIAEVLYKRHPQLFRDIENARDLVRYHRGARGATQLKELKDKTFVRAPQKTSAGFPRLPTGITSFEHWSTVKLSGPCKALVLSDIHVPYHDREAIEIACDQLPDATLVILNGDTMDCYEQSEFVKDPRLIDFPGALDKGRQFVRWIRNRFPKAKIIYKMGNHDERLERYFFTRAPAVIGVSDFELQTLLRLEANEVEHVGERRPIKVGKLNIIHGHEYRFAISNPVSPARGLFNRAQGQALCGHFHQWSNHSARDINGTVISTFSTGCLCQLHPEFLPLNNWSHGAATVKVDTEGNFTVNNFKIINGKVY